MADTTFVSGVTTVSADWLNDVNDNLYHLNLGNSDRSLVSKLQDFVSVKDYGAVGDGVTDDYTAIQACLDACNTAGGGTVFFPRGTYLCNTPLRVLGGTNIVGAGRDSCTILKDSTTTRAVAIVAGSLVTYGGTLPSNLNAILILDGTGGRYAGHISDITLEGGLSTPSNYETQKVEFGIVSVGSVADYTRERVNIESVQYAEIYPIIFVSELKNSRFSTCLRGLSIDNGTSTDIVANYANNCRDWGFYLRDLKYSEISGNAVDNLNDPTKYPTRTRTCAAYKLRSMLGCTVVNNGNEETYGRSFEFNSFDYSLFENNLTIGVGSDYTGSDEIAVFYSTNTMLGSRVVDNFAYNVKAGGLTYGGAVSGQHHNIYFEGTTFIVGTEWRRNLVASARNGTTEAGWGNNTFYEWMTGSATYDPASLADGAGVTTTVTCTGAALGDYAIASFSLDLQGITLTAWVSSANTVSVRFQNESGGVIDLGSGTLRVRTYQRQL